MTVVVPQAVRHDDGRVRTIQKNRGTMRCTARVQLALPAALSGALIGVVALAGCAAIPDGPTRQPSSAPPVTASPAPVAESFTKYDALRAELVAALEQKLPGITWSVDNPARLAKSSDGRCILQPASMKSSADIVEPSNHFKEVFTAGDPVLGKHGFPAFGGTDDVPGGWVVARSTDGSGATVSIESKNPAYLRITVPVASSTCDSKEIPAG